MTAIAGFVDEGRVWIGGDSAGISGYDLTVRADSKVFRNGEFLFGFTSSFRMGQLLRFSLTVSRPVEGQDLFEYMCTKFVNAVRDCLKSGGYAQRNNEEESGGHFLVGFRGRLFTVGSDYQVAEARAGYTACGCGSAYCIGALFATAESSLGPQKRMNVALSAAEQNSAGVRGPFVVEFI